VAEFILDARIEASSHSLLRLSLSELRLQDDGRFPWLVLIPRRAGAVELFDLAAEDQTMLLAELAFAGRAVRALGAAFGLPVEKLNIANLGNVVPQLHWHVVGRSAADPCWPGPVWGQGEAQKLTPEQVEAARKAVNSALAGG
jgi:diadenosine tetraphosphate (Ap4A) HIT family hydrolase